MPDAAPARLSLDQALDESLRLLFRGLQAEPVPDALLSLVDRLEGMHGAGQVHGESRFVA